jgi:hypothetical protein
LWASAAAAEPTLEQLTFGPKHHFFGYIGQCRTIPWSGDGRYILALQIAFVDRMPEPEDAAEIVLIDTQDHNRLREVERTRAWNPQQGTMFYWDPQHPSTRFFFNDRDPKSGKVFTVLFDIKTSKREREFRFEDTPVGNGGVAQSGGWFSAINYARLARLRPVTGYPKAYDWTTGIGAPTNDGIFRVEVETGQKKLVVSCTQLKEALEEMVPDIESRHLFINHTLCNRDSDRIYFYCRADFEGESSRRVNVPFTVKPDGSELTIQRVFIGGHPDWADGRRMIGASDKKQVLYDVVSQKIIETLGGPEIFPDPGGDISLSPDGRWLVNGHTSKAGNAYTFLDLKTRRVIKHPALPVGKWSRSELRLDPAPCWNRSSDAIVVTALAKDGTRQMFLLRPEK